MLPHPAVISNAMVLFDFSLKKPDQGITGMLNDTE
jgi:hypothetical protein